VKALANGYLKRSHVSRDAISDRLVDVWIPVGDPPPSGFPLLIVQDGQNLFVDGAGGSQISWRLADTISRLAELGRIDPPIVMGIWNTENRWSEYCPPLVMEMRDPSGDPIPSRPSGDSYASFLMNDLVPTLTKGLATNPQRRFAMGSSMGGLISLYALCEYPELLGGAASLSTHWPIVAEAIVPYLEMHLPAPGQHRVYFDRGTIGLDASYQETQELVDRTFVSEGWRPGIDWISKTFPNADHNETAWAKRIESPLEFLLGRAPS